ncbi:cupin domain-containing protein [Vibrio sp. F74]|uniref:cupin domain-containing protein n=1 Tax=Vibrio sp. F74 TaxID=700020 RepID=UPI0035F58CAF
MKKIPPINVELVPVNMSKSIYPEPFADRVKDRTKRKLGDFFQLENFGVNYTVLAPNSMSALKHHHIMQDEFIYVIAGNPTLIYGEDEIQMNPGDCMGFKANSGVGHQLVNNTSEDVIFIEVGDRSPNESVTYPDDDLALTQEINGSWSVLHKDGSTY